MHYFCGYRHDLIVAIVIGAMAERVCGLGSEFENRVGKWPFAYAIAKGPSARWSFVYGWRNEHGMTEGFRLLSGFRFRFDSHSSVPVAYGLDRTVNEPKNEWNNQNWINHSFQIIFHCDLVPSSSIRTFFLPAPIFEIWPTTLSPFRSPSSNRIFYKSSSAHHSGGSQTEIQHPNLEKNEKKINWNDCKHITFHLLPSIKFCFPLSSSLRPFENPVMVYGSIPFSMATISFLLQIFVILFVSVICLRNHLQLLFFLLSRLSAGILPSIDRLMVVSFARFVGCPLFDGASSVLGDFWLQLELIDYVTINEFVMKTINFRFWSRLVRDAIQFLDCDGFASVAVHLV